jgi:transcriptional regulator with XRE-family HTH domain
MIARELNGVVRRNRTRPGIDRVVRRRLRETIRSIGRELVQLRTDTGATQAAVARVAGIDRSHLTRIEAGTTGASLETLIAVTTALGADLSLRLYPGTGPKLTDRHQAPMVEALIRALHRSWRPHPEVPVFRPARGVIDLVLERPAERLLVAVEVQSEIRRLEQVIRWSAEKAASLESSGLVRPGPPWHVSRMLLLRSTTANREVARSFESTLGAAYPAAAAQAIAALRGDATWPGPGILWIRTERGKVELLDVPPRGVRIGRVDGRGRTGGRSTNGDPKSAIGA